MKRIGLMFLALCLSITSLAQGEGNVWMMGYQCGIDFNSDSPEAIISEIRNAEGTAAVSDEYGNLLFYSDGDSVWNSDHNIMPNGAGLSPFKCWSTTQGCISFPVVGTDSLYYIFSLGYESLLDPTTSLSYSVLDMSLDGGQGDILSTPSAVFVADGLSEKMTAIAGHCGNIWLIVCSIIDNSYYAYEITAEGISSPVISPTEISSVLRTALWHGVIKISPNGKKLVNASYASGGQFVLYDFDMETGIVSNAKPIVGEASAGSANNFYGACFSPDNTKLYARGLREILQFEITSEELSDIVESRYVVDSFDLFSASLGDIKAGPDGKIYFPSGSSSYLSVIHQPNMAGEECDYSPEGLLLAPSSFGGWGLPNETVIPVINPDTTISSSIDTMVCAGSLLYGRSGAFSYLWNSGEMTSSININESGIYQVTSYVACRTYTDTFKVDIIPVTTPDIHVSDTLLCSPSTAILLSATVDSSIGTTYQWQPSEAILSDTDDSAVWVNPTLTTVFYITVTDFSGTCQSSATDSITITLFNNKVDILSNDTTICSGDQILLNAKLPEGHNSEWSPTIGLTSPSSSTTLLTGIETTEYIFTSSFGHCFASDTILLTVEQTPEVLLGNDTTLCDYEKLQLAPFILPADDPTYSYSWLPTVHFENPAIKNAIFNGSSSYSGKLSLTVLTPAGCIGKDSINVLVNSSDFMLVTPTDTGMCPPVSLQLHAENATSYLWQPEYGLDNDTSANPVATPEISTNYLITGISDNGCVDSQYVLVEVYSEALVDLPDSILIYPGESYQINPEGNATVFNWFPPSGLSAANIPNPIASPTVRTRYFFNAFTEHGCMLRDSIDIYVSTETVLDMPNAFVPGTGDNNTFKLSKRGIASVKSFHIFNRWGNKVFETTDINKGWDGTYNGTPQPAGVYIYTIDAVTSTGKPFVKQGNVTLIR